MSTIDRTEIQTVLAALRDMDDTDLAIVAENLGMIRRSRARASAHARTGRIAVGDRVRFNDRIRPRYMVGMEATVAKLNDKSIGVLLDPDADPRALDRFGRGVVRCPRVLVDAIEEES